MADDLRWTWGPLARVAVPAPGHARPAGPGPGPVDRSEAATWRTCRGHRLPRMVVLADGDNQLVCDLDRATVGRGAAPAAEGPGPRPPSSSCSRTPDELCVTGPEGRFTHELVVPFVRTSPAPGAPARKAGPADPRSRDRPPPLPPRLGVALRQALHRHRHGRPACSSTRPAPGRAAASATAWPTPGSSSATATGAGTCGCGCTATRRRCCPSCTPPPSPCWPTAACGGCSSTPTSARSSATAATPAWTCRKPSSATTATPSSTCWRLLDGDDGLDAALAAGPGRHRPPARRPRLLTAGQGSGGPRTRRDEFAAEFRADANLQAQLGRRYRRRAPVPGGASPAADPRPRPPPRPGLAVLARRSEAIAAPVGRTAPAGRCRSATWPPATPTCTPTACCAPATGPRNWCSTTSSPACTRRGCTVADLFRQEALDHHAGRGGPGDVLRVAPRWTGWLFWLVLVSVARPGWRRGSCASTASGCSRCSSAVARRIPYIQQVELADCGAACLAMVLAYHGRHVPLKEVRDVTGHGPRRRRRRPAGPAPPTTTGSRPAACRPTSTTSATSPRDRSCTGSSPTSSCSSGSGGGGWSWSTRRPGGSGSPCPRIGRSYTGVAVILEPTPDLIRPGAGVVGTVALPPADPRPVAPAPAGHRHLRPAAAVRPGHPRA